jgi:magnesium transporter
MQILRSPDPSQVRDLIDRGEFFWLDLDAPTGQSLREIGEILRLHELALEDTREFGQRPKVDAYDDALLIVFYGADRDRVGRPQGVEVHLHVSDRYVFTVHRRSCQAFDRMCKRVEDAPPDENVLIYRVLDALTDSALEVIESLAETVEDHVTEVFHHPRARDRDYMAALRRSLEPFRRIFVTQRQVFERLVERLGEMQGDSDDLSSYYRDVGDHLWRVVDEIEAARDSIQNMLDTYSNEVQERLTIVATIFLPLTLVSSFFGQNFNWMIDHIGSAWAFWGIGVGGTALALATILLWLTRSGLFIGPQRGWQRSRAGSIRTPRERRTASALDEGGAGEGRIARRALR